MNSKDEILEYLVKRSDRIASKYQLSEGAEDMHDIRDKLHRAVKMPSVNCAPGNKHKFELLLHLNEKTDTIYYLHCAHCGEVVESTNLNSAKI